MTDDKFLQEQINDLQKACSSLEAEVTGVTEQMGRARDDIVVLGDHVTSIKRDMITADKMAIVLENERNQQIVRGLKYAAGLVIAAVAVKWVEAMDWFHHLGE
jgi:hypothetical protein